MMPNRLHARVLLVLTLGMVPMVSHSAVAEDASRGEVLFAVKVRPLLAEKCLACHGDEPDDLKGGLDLSTRVAMRAGGETSDTVLVPGDAANSLLYTAVTGEDDFLVMPPKQNDRLTREQAWQIRDWINEGAPWPDERGRRDRRGGSSHADRGPRRGDQWRPFR